MTKTLVKSPTGALLYVPDGFEGPPRSVADVLRRVSALVDEEGRWTRCAWLLPESMYHPDYREDPFCNGWAVCADGALQLVSLGILFNGLRWNIDQASATRHPLYQEAYRVALAAINELHGDHAPVSRGQRTGSLDTDARPGWTSIPRFNDAFATRTQVVNALAVAAAGHDDN